MYNIYTRNTHNLQAPGALRHIYTDTHILLSHTLMSIVNTYVHMCTYTCIPMYTCTHIHIYTTHTHTHLYIYTCVQINNQTCIHTHGFIALKTKLVAKLVATKGGGLIQPPRSPPCWEHSSRSELTHTHYSQTHSSMT